MIRRPFHLLSILFFGIALSACGPSTLDVDPTLSMSVDELYRSARSELEKENFQTAIEQYETLESRFPFGKHATQAQLDVAYTYYKYDEPDAAIAAVDRFIKLNPRHESVDYAYYLKGLVNFDRGANILDSISERDKAEYDRFLLQQSFDDFQILSQRFPDSQYIPDAQQHMLFLRNELARLDLKIIEFYAGRKAWVAVVNRARFIIENYQGTEVMEQTLRYQLEAYENLELTELARDTRRILELNYSQDS